MVLSKIFENVRAKDGFFKQGKELAEQLVKGIQSKIAGHDYVLSHQILLRWKNLVSQNIFISSQEIQDIVGGAWK